ncbi:hypothetical protein Syun_014876 [Stephania yunnanensis]|uniref:Uncharacterized protein n=1 Tax=Stephania yunnanensis TaxID=152371 RepID=A0AAP0JK51_9MAGN
MVGSMEMESDVEDFLAAFMARSLRSATPRRWSRWGGVVAIDVVRGGELSEWAFIGVDSTDVSIASPLPQPHPPCPPPPPLSRPPPPPLPRLSLIRLPSLSSSSFTSCSRSSLPPPPSLASIITIFIFKIIFKKTNFFDNMSEYSDGI